MASLSVLTNIADTIREVIGGFERFAKSLVEVTVGGAIWAAVEKLRDQMRSSPHKFAARIAKIITALEENKSNFLKAVEHVYGECLTTFDVLSLYFELLEEDDKKDAKELKKILSTNILQDVVNAVEKSVKKLQDIRKSAGALTGEITELEADIKRHLEKHDFSKVKIVLGVLGTIAAVCTGVGGIAFASTAIVGGASAVAGIATAAGGGVIGAAGGVTSIVLGVGEKIDTKRSIRHNVEASDQIFDKLEKFKKLINDSIQHTTDFNSKVERTKKTESNAILLQGGAKKLMDYCDRYVKFVSNLKL